MKPEGRFLTRMSPGVPGSIFLFPVAGSSEQAFAHSQSPVLTVLCKDKPTP